MQEIALQVLDIAEQGLQRRAILDRCGNDETSFLAILREIAERGSSAASGELLQLYKTKWGAVSTQYIRIRLLDRYFKEGLGLY